MLLSGIESQVSSPSIAIPTELSQLFYSKIKTNYEKSVSYISRLVAASQSFVMKGAFHCHWFRR
jgi:hypothetical protein